MHACQLYTLHSTPMQDPLELYLSHQYRYAICVLIVARFGFHCIYYTHRSAVGLRSFAVCCWQALNRLDIPSVIPSFKQRNTRLAMPCTISPLRAVPHILSWWDCRTRSSLEVNGISKVRMALPNNVKTASSAASCIQQGSKALESQQPSTAC
jgi:hypothetical protein